MHFLPKTFHPRGRDQERDIEKGGMSGSTLLLPPGVQPLSRRATMLEPEAMHQLDTFRHMVGIHSTKGFVSQIMGAKGGFLADNSHNNLHFDGRAAPNLGIYNRVCHREAQAKRGYKFASVMINGCLGVQIIVAAALTAMGAANSSHIGITAFGAINTVIAGLLTYLKGSGLPNRIRYYENEWKRVREFIEQRERDFSRPDCRLDVNEVVNAIEAMYEQVKVDIQTNIPDNYISVSDVRARATAATTPKFDLSGLRGTVDHGRSRLEELELKYGHKATDFLESLAHKEEERLKRIEGDIEGSKARALAALQEGRSTLHRKGSDWAQDLEKKGARVAEQELDHARIGVRDWEQDMEKRGTRFAEDGITHAKSGLLQRGTSFAKDLEHTRAGILQRGEDLTRDLDVANSAAFQRGRDYGNKIEVKAARFTEAEHNLGREAERARQQAYETANSIHRAGDSVQKAGDSIGRVANAMNDEIQPIVPMSTTPPSPPNTMYHHQSSH